MNISIVVDGESLCGCVISEEEIKYRTATQVHDLMQKKTSQCMREYLEGLFSLSNVRRQVSLAGGNGGSQESGAKALGLLCFSQALCLSAKPR